MNYPPYPIEAPVSEVWQVIQQGVIRLHCREAAVLVNLDRVQRQAILHADLYAEQDVFLEDGRSERKASIACLDLNTRGELKILANKTKVLQQAVPDAPLFQRALKELYGLNVTRQPRAPGSEEPAERRPTGPSAPPPVRRLRGPRRRTASLG